MHSVSQRLISRHNARSDLAALGESISPPTLRRQRQNKHKGPASLRYQPNSIPSLIRQGVIGGDRGYNRRVPPDPKNRPPGHDPQDCSLPPVQGSSNLKESHAAEKSQFPARPSAGWFHPMQQLPAALIHIRQSGLQAEGPHPSRSSSSRSSSSIDFPRSAGGAPVASSFRVERRARIFRLMAAWEVRRPLSW